MTTARAARLARTPTLASLAALTGRHACSSRRFGARSAFVAGAAAVWARKILRVLSSERPNQGAGDVAVVISSRDRWQFLRTALASALAQTKVDVDVVVVDDGSIDRTESELRKLSDDRVRVVRLEPPEGVSAARNVGLAHVRARWVAFLDDDDVWAPGHLAAMLDALRDSGVEHERVGLVFSGHLELDADRHVTAVSPAAPADSVHDGLKRMNVVGCPSRVVLRTDAVRAVGGFDPELSMLADWDLWVRVLAGNEVVRCRELLVGYTQHAGNMHLDAERFLADLATLREKHGWSRRGARDAVSGDLLPSYLAATYRRGGRRFRAALWYSRAFRARRDPRDLGRIAGVLLGERLIELSGLRRRTLVEPALGRWVEDMRVAERMTKDCVALRPGRYGDTPAP